MRGWDTMLCYNSFDKIDSWQNLALYLKPYLLEFFINLPLILTFLQNIFSTVLNEK